MSMKTVSLLACFLTACGSGGPPPADWKMNAVSLLEHAQARWLEGDAKAAELALQKARGEIARSGRLDLLARAELSACATHAAVLDFSPCMASAALAGDATPGEKAYAQFLAGGWTGLDARQLPVHYQPLAGAKDDAAANRAALEIKDPLPRLIGLALLFKQGRIQPEGLAGAVDAASERGWRRPLLAWLEVTRQRAQASGDQEAVQRIGRRIELVMGMAKR